MRAIDRVLVVILGAMVIGVVATREPKERKNIIPAATTPEKSSYQTIFNYESLAAQGRDQGNLFNTTVNNQTSTQNSYDRMVDEVYMYTDTDLYGASYQEVREAYEEL